MSGRIVKLLIVGIADGGREYWEPILSVLYTSVLFEFFTNVYMVLL